MMIDAQVHLWESEGRIGPQWMNTIYSFLFFCIRSLCRNDIYKTESISRPRVLGKENVYS